MPDFSNLAIAAALDELGDLYELDGAVIHRVLAYRTAARAIRDAPMSGSALAREGRVTELPGVGKTLAEQVTAGAAEWDVQALSPLRFGPFAHNRHWITTRAVDAFRRTFS